MLRKATNENIKVWFCFSCDSKLHYYSKNVSSNNNPSMTIPNKYLGGKQPKVSSGFNILKIKIELMMQTAHVFDPLKVEFNFHFNFSLSRENEIYLRATYRITRLLKHEILTIRKFILHPNIKHATQ
jgi:hypothetical protein